MCGIIGIKGSSIDPKLFKTARDTLSHRGPDDKGFYHSEEHGVLLGHTRLSIIDLSSSGHQPFISADGRYVIVFNGEIYNYSELKKELLPFYDFVTKTDTEVLLASYMTWKEKCLTKLNGMFSFAIWDNEEGVLFAARDRLGEKPFFYSFNSNTLFFASEIKALLSLGVSKKPNERMIFDYLNYGLYDHTENTFFSDINTLKSGHYMVFKNGKVKMDRYWDLKGVPVDSCTDDEYVENKFKDLLKDSIRLRFRSDVPVGLNLSSGLDSNSLYYYSHALLGKYPETFSMCLPSQEYNECEILNRVLSEDQKKGWNTCGILPDEVFPLARIMNQIQDQPYGGIPTIAYANLIQTAFSKGVTVLLEGQGLDEILAGYKYYETDLENDLTNEKTTLNSAVLSQDMTREIFPEILSSDFVKKNMHEILFERPFESNLLNAQYRDLIYSKLPRVLRFNDHASMAYGRELRMPYLDHRIVEYCFSLPTRFKLNKKGHKVLLRSVMKEYLPVIVESEQKKAFGGIQTEWFRRYLKKDVMNLIQSKTFKLRPYWNHEALEKKIIDFFEGNGDNSFFIWQCINLELWFKSFVD